MMANVMAKKMTQFRACVDRSSAADTAAGELAFSAKPDSIYCPPLPIVKGTILMNCWRTLSIVRRLLSIDSSRPNHHHVNHALRRDKIRETHANHKRQDLSGRRDQIQLDASEDRDRRRAARMGRGNELAGFAPGRSGLPTRWGFHYGPRRAPDRLYLDQNLHGHELVGPGRPLVIRNQRGGHCAMGY